MADISNANNNSIVNGTTSDDRISNIGLSATIYAYGGNDSIQNGNYGVSEIGMYSKIFGGDDNDTIFNFGNNVTVNGGAGDDSLHNDGCDGDDGINFGVLLDGGDGNDKFTNDGGINLTILGGAGKDNIFSGGDNVVIDGGADNDKIENWVSNISNSINGGGGNDSIWNREDSIYTTIFGGSGADYIENFGDSAIIDGGNDNDFIYNDGNSSFIDGGVGDDSIQNSSYNSTINGGDGSDSIWNGEESIYTTINGGSGADEIHNYGASAIIDGGEGNDNIQNHSYNSTINGGDGSDTIWNWEESSIYTTINGGSGNDEIHNYGASATVNGDNGNDLISNGGDFSTINGGEGNDTIQIGGYNVIVDGGEGIDNISTSGINSTVFGGEGNDIIFNGGHSTFVDGGVGDDSIKNFAHNSTINGGEGVDNISNSGINATVLGGAGEDIITNFGTGIIDGGEDNDAIYNFATSDVEITGGSGTNEINLFNGSDSSVVVDVSEGTNDVINVYDTVVTHFSVNGFSAGNEIKFFMDQKISGLTETKDGKGTVINTTTNSGDVAVTVDGLQLSDGDLGWYMTDKANNVASLIEHTVAGGYSVDAQTIAYRGESFGETSIVVNGITNVAGFGYSAATGGGASIASLDGAGFDTKVEVTKNVGYVLALSGAVNAGTSFLGLNDADNGDSIISSIVDLSIYGRAGGDSIINFGGSAIIDGGEGNDIIFNGGHSTFVDGGVGDDSIKNFAHNSTINGGEGNDTIENGGDRAFIDGGLGDDEIIFNIDPALGVHSSVSINGSDGNDSIRNTGGADAVILNGGIGDDYIYNWEGFNSTLLGGYGADTIYNESSTNVFIDAGAGNDSIRTSDTYRYYNGNDGDYVTVDAGAGEDFISNTANNVSINGGAGNDLINLNDGTGTTINVSEGDDTINVSASIADFVVEDFGAGDVIQLTSTPESITTIDGGIVAGNVTIKGITSSTHDDGSWTTSTNSITYHTGSTAGASLNGNTITYSTVSSGSDEFTITGLSSTVGVSIDGSKVILNSTALNGVSGTVSISGGDYVLSLASDVDTPSTTSGGWNTVGNDGVAVYGTAGTTPGWSMSDDKKSITYTAKGTSDSLLVLKGIAPGATLNDISSYYAWQLVSLTADNFGNDGVTVASNPNNYMFRLNGDFEGKSFTGTDNADHIDIIEGSNLSINGGEGNDSIIAGNVSINSDTNVTINGGAGNDDIRNLSLNALLLGGNGEDTIGNYAEYISINGGDGNDYIFNSDSGIYSTIDGGNGNDIIANFSASVLIYGRIGDDYIYNYANNVSINGGASSNVISLLGGEGVTVNVDSGNDIINVSSASVASFAVEGFSVGDTIHFDSAISGMSMVNGLLNVTVDGKTITISGVSMSAEGIGWFADDPNTAVLREFVDAGAFSSGTNDIIYRESLAGDSMVALTGVTDTAGFSFALAENGSMSIAYLDAAGFSSIVNVIENIGFGLSIAGADGTGKTFFGMSTADTIWNSVANLAISGGSGSDIITNSGDSAIIDGGADNDLINLNDGTGTTINVSEGDDTINVSASIADFVVEGFNAGDVIQLASTPESITTIDGGIVAGNVTIKGITSSTQDDGSWTTSTNSITYHTGSTAGASLNGNTITYSTVSSGSDEFTITGLSSTVGVSVDGSKVILNSTALAGVSGTVSISGGDYVLSLASDVDTPSTTSGGWNTVGSNGVAVYGAAVTTSGWSMSDDSKSITYKAKGTSDSLLVLKGIAPGATLNDISDEGQLFLTADNFGNDGVTVASNPNSYHFFLNGDFNGKSFTGTSNNDSIYNYGTNLSIISGDGNDSISNYLGDGAIIDGGTGDDTVMNWGANVSIIGGVGNDSITNRAEGSNATLDGGSGDDVINNWAGEVWNEDTQDYDIDPSPDNTEIRGGVGNDTLYNEGSSTTIDGDSGNDLIQNGYSHMAWERGGSNVLIIGGADNDTICNFGTFASIYAGDGNDSIDNYDSNVLINGGADNDIVRLVEGENATVNVSDGDDTIIISDSIASFAVEGFGAGDVIQLASTPESITTIDGGIVAGNVTIKGITSSTQDDGSWTTSTNSITYHTGSTAGASLNGNTITYSTVSSGSDEFTITGLSSTVGVSVDSSKVILNSTALDGVSGTVSISGGDYVLSLASDVDIPSTTSGGWNTVGNDGVAVYGAAVTTSGWSMSDDSKSITYKAKGTSDSLLVLKGIAPGATLNNISDEGQLPLTADNFGNDGVTVASNSNSYHFVLNGDFESKSFTGTNGIDIIYNRGENVSIDGDNGADEIYNYGGDNVSINGGDNNDYIYTDGNHALIGGGMGNDTIVTDNNHISVNGGADDDLIDLIGSTGTTVNVSEGNDTISVRSSVEDFAVEGFGAGDVIQLASTPESFTTIDGGIIADNVTIKGINSIAQDGEGWTTSTNSITYHTGSTAGASLNGNTITYSTVSSGSDEFTITGLNSTVGVSIDGSQVILSSAALDSASDIVSISGGDYVLTLADDVDIYETTSGSWDEVGSDGTAVYRAGGMTEGWLLADDSKSATYMEETRDDLLVLKGVKPGATLINVSDDGVVSLTADVFGNDGVTVDSNPNNYTFNLSGDFEGNSFTATNDADTVENYGSNISINLGDSDDTFRNYGSNVTVNGGTGNDTLDNVEGSNNVISAGDGDDSIGSGGNNAFISAGNGNNVINVSGTNNTVEGGADNDLINSSGENVSINAGDGNDVINAGGANSTVEGGNGDDSINGSGENSTLNAGDGNDAVSVNGNNSSVDGGMGDDYITIGSGLEVVISYTEGQGNDTIYGYSESVDLQINSSDEWSSVTSGNDVILNINDNSSITLIDAAGIIEPSEEEVYEEPEIINADLPGRVVFANWGYGFTPQSDSPLYDSPALSEVTPTNSPTDIILQGDDELTSLSDEINSIATPSES